MAYNRKIGAKCQLTKVSSALVAKKCTSAGYLRFYNNRLQSDAKSKKKGFARTGANRQIDI